MSFSASILIILLPFFLSLHFCHSISATHISEKAKPNQTNAMAASYLAPEEVKRHMLKKTNDVKSVLAKNVQSKHFKGSKESQDDSTKENTRAETKNKSTNSCRKLRIVISETKAKSSAISSRGEHKKKRNSGIDIDYDPPKTHPPSHN